MRRLWGGGGWGGCSFPPRRPGPLRSNSCLCWDLPRSQTDPAEADREGTVPTDMALRASGCCPVGNNCVIRPLHFSLMGLESSALLQILSLSTMGSRPRSPAKCFCEAAQTRLMFWMECSWVYGKDFSILEGRVGFPGQRLMGLFLLSLGGLNRAGFSLRGLEQSRLLPL